MRHIYRYITASLLGLVAAASASASLLSELTDPAQPALAGELDILSARIDQDGGLLTFSMEMRGDIPTTFANPDDTLTFLWFVDADNNPATGQPYPNLGSDFNVRAVVFHNALGGWVDVCGDLPGGGEGAVTVNGATITITVGLGQIANPRPFHWRCDTFFWHNNSHVWGNGLTTIAVADPAPYAPPARVTLATPYLMLSPAGPTTGQLDVEIRDAADNVQPTSAYHLAFRSSDSALVTVDSAGLATLHTVSNPNEDTAYIDVTADGVPASNSALVRSTSTNLGVTHHMYAASHISFCLPMWIESVNLDALTTGYDVVAATDFAYEAQIAGAGTLPFGGGRQFFVLDVTDNPATVPCGMSGNPMRLGWQFGKLEHNSCYIVNAPGNQVPQWFVIWHELGHNFNGPSWSFWNFAVIGSPYDGTYCEGFASLCALWSWHSALRCWSGLNDMGLINLAQEFGGTEQRFSEALTHYESNGANYTTIDADIVDGIFLALRDEYGEAVWYNLFSVFLPANSPLPVTIDTMEKQATFFIAIASAATWTDLRSRFVWQYGFPLDETVWDEYLAAAEDRMAARPWPYPPGDLDCNTALDSGDVAVLGLCMLGPEHLVLPGRSMGDLNGDGFVDLTDFAWLQVWLPTP